MPEGGALDAAYKRLEEAVNEVARLEGFEGVLTEWITVVATHRYDEDGTGVGQVGHLMPDGGGGVPYHRAMGLLDYTLTRMRAEVARDD